MRLIHEARRADARRRGYAVEVLAAMDERGALMALARDNGPQAALASKALEELSAEPQRQP